MNYTIPLINDVINDDKEIVIDDYQGKDVEFSLSKDDFLETASEIRFKTLFLENLPIKYRNFSKTWTFIKSTSWGTASVNFGFETLDNVNIKLLEFPKFAMIEFKKREFRLALGVVRDSNGLYKSNDLFDYEINSSLKNARLKVVLEFLSNLFKGTTIKFHFGVNKYEFNFVNHIEHFKLNSMRDFLLNYENLVDRIKLFKYKNLADTENSFYEIDVLDKATSIEENNTWINAKLLNKDGIRAGDKLTLRRLHKMNFYDFPYDIEEEIVVLQPISGKDIKDNFIILNHRAIKVRYNKIDK